MPRWLPFFGRKKKKKRSAASSHQTGKKPSTRAGGSGSSGRSRKPASKQPPFNLRRGVRKTLIALSAALAAMLLWVLLSLPSVDRLYKDNANPGIVIYDAQGDIINTYGSVYGRYLRYDDIPEHLIHAILATEDRLFFYHMGFDPIGLLRAAVANMRAGRVVQGGSTITQQVAKNLFLSSERTYTRKFRELLMAMKLEWYFSKEKLMEIYVNRVYLGAGTFGIDAASQRYFDKPAAQLNVAESAILTGLLKAPSRFAPTSNPALTKKRARQILINMSDAGYLTEKQEASAVSLLDTVVSAAAPPSSNNYYYTDWIVEEIPGYIGEITEDIVVLTTMDVAMQKMAEEAITKHINDEAKQKLASQASLIAMEPDGAVKALMGGTNYGKSQYNRAVQAHRQPGSAFKLFVYLSALEQGAYPDMLVDDHPVSVGKWSPRNYSGEYEGVMEMRRAVARSINTVAVQLSELYGRGNVLAMARSLGVESPLEATPSLALGAYEVTLMEMVTGFAHLASNGLAVRPYGITKIMNKKGDVLYERKAETPARVLSGQVVAMANDVFSSVITSGTATRANLGRPAAGKTGTTSDYRDAWFIGYTPQLVGGVWVGNDNAKAMKKVTGGNIPASIWRDFMHAALQGKPALSLPIAAPENRNEGLPWTGGEPDTSAAPGVGGRHLPWNDSAAQPSPPRYNDEDTQQLLEKLRGAE